MRNRTIRPLLLSLTAVSALVVLLGASRVTPAPGDAPSLSPVTMSIARAEVTHVLSAQAVAWNRNDLPAFVASYAEDATFLTPSGITNGRKAILERYQKRYPDGKAMGSLTLDMAEVRPLGVDVATATVNGLSVVAHWKLAHPDDPNAKTDQGFTLLVLQRHGGRWEIVQDASL
jgi:uncharacterized protein (TIGR02246 family)